MTHLEHDLYPWTGPNGSRIPTRYGYEEHDTFEPRPGFCRERECYGLTPIPRGHLK